MAENTSGGGEEILQRWQCLGGPWKSNLSHSLLPMLTAIAKDDNDKRQMTVTVEKTDNDGGERRRWQWLLGEDRWRWWRRLTAMVVHARELFAFGSYFGYSYWVLLFVWCAGKKSYSNWYFIFGQNVVYWYSYRLGNMDYQYPTFFTKWTKLVTGMGFY